MNDFENKMKSLLNKTQNYSTVEFYFEQYNIQKEIKQLKASIGTVSIYTPSFELKIPDLKDETKKIQEDLKAKLDSYMKPVDNSFALECFKYATEEMGNEQIARIYSLLGPFDYSLWRDEALEDEDQPYLSDEEEDKEERRMPQEHFEKRRSGAMYRGEVLSTNRRPDGKGFKVFNGASVYEGTFHEGACHGIGRGITARGEVYQGDFHQDQMSGLGYFVWPDGRIYEGEWSSNMKHGKGTYYFANGQVYKGDFKNDECHGTGTLFYPDGKRYEGQWREGKKNGKGTYIFPNNSLYNCVYQDGKKQNQGQLIDGNASVAQMKEEYQSLAKRAIQGKEFMEKHHIKADKFMQDEARFKQNNLNNFLNNDIR